MFSGVLVMVGTVLALGACISANPVASSLSQPGPGPSDYNMRNSMLDVWQVLARHGALEPDHQLARKSVRSPSRRLRFGRRSDPLMPPQPETRDLEELQEELLPERDIRAPVRMRFGRRSVEQAVPHILPMPDSDENSMLRKEIRTPSMRLRFGRRADVLMLPYEQAEREFRNFLETEENAED